MVAKTYICLNCQKNNHKPDLISEPLTYVPKCHRCSEYMVEGEDK